MHRRTTRASAARQAPRHITKLTVDGGDARVLIQMEDRGDDRAQQNHNHGGRNFLSRLGGQNQMMTTPVAAITTVAQLG